MRSIPRILTALAGAAAAAMAAGCGDSTNADTAQVTVLLADAPADVFADAIVEIGELQLLPLDGGPAVTLTDNGGTYDLLDLQDGVTASLASLAVDPGTYHQLRLVVNAASVTLVDTLFFMDGSQSKNLLIPSGAQTGIKITLRGDDDAQAGVEITPGVTILVVDFDVSQNFRLQGAVGTPAGIQDALFTPLLRAVVQDVAGSIAGSVMSSATGDPLIGATVRATLTNPGTIAELETSEATAVTDSAGAYKLWYLAPGTYSVAVDSLSAGSQSVAVGAGEDITGVDFSGTF